MKHRNLRLVVLALIAVAMLATTACRSKTKTKPQTAPPPPPVQEAPREVPPPPKDDFVVEEQPEVSAYDLSGDLATLNRRAHEMGWIRDAFFEYDAFTLSQEAQDNLAASARWLRENPQFRLLIEGHADERGTNEYNLALGERRAHTAKEYLVRLGIDPVRVRTVSYGEERPFARGSNESAWRQNRRAHLVLER